MDYLAIADAQQACPDTGAAKRSSNTLQMVKIGDVQLLCDTRGPHLQPLIPGAHHRQIFTAFHSLAHPGIKATGWVMGSGVTWPYMKRDVNNWVKDCLECSHAKVTRQPAAAVQPIPVPTQRFSHIHMDFV